MGGLDQRQGFLVSATVHLLILTLLSSTEVLGPSPKKAAPEDPSQQVIARVMLPPAEVLRQLVPRPPRPPAPPPAPVPAPTPPPAEARAKDKISIGPPSTERAKGPLELRREDDLTAIPKGRPNAAPTPPPTPPPAAAADAGRAAETAGTDAPGAGGLRLPEGLGGLQRSGDDGLRGQRGAASPSIASSLRNLERRLQDSGPAGLPTGTGGQQMGPLFFDPEGADFTVWINHFKNEVYRNWIVPQPALMGFRGHVDIEFTVERDGRMSAIRMLKSAGTPALDRAALNALQGSLLMRLPADYGPPRITMQVTFFYNEGPRES